MAALDPVLVGTVPDDGLGDPLRDAFIKINSNEALLNAQLNLAQERPTTRVVVNVKSNLPTPSAGVITLADNTEYLIGDSVDLGTDRIEFGADSVVNGSTNRVAKLIYTGTGTMFTSVDQEMTILRVALDCANGTLISAEDTVGNEGIHRLVLQDVDVEAALKLGDITNISSFVILSTRMSFVDGFDFFGDNFNTIAGHFFAAIVGAGTGVCFDLGTCKANTILLNDQTVVLPAGTKFLVGAADSANINVGGSGVVSFTAQLGAGDALVGIDVKDERWNFVSNNTIQNTNRDRLNNQIIVNKLEDFPAAVGGLITLADDRQYVVGDNFSIGTDRLKLGANTTLSGADSITVALTYTGTGDMLTTLNTSNSVNKLTLVAMSGRLLNVSDNTDALFRMDDCIVQCNKFGVFNSTGTNGSKAKFTGVDIDTLVTDGCEITGDWNTWLWEVSAANITAGDLFNLGTATFDDFVLDLIRANISAGANLIDGAASSANIKTGGAGLVSRMLTGGAGAPLNGITTEDALWEFRANTGIKDTRADGLVSVRENATETVIAEAGTNVKVNAVFTVESTSQFTGDTTGRLTYVGGKPITVPITVTTTVAAASGTNKSIETVLGLNGTPIDASGVDNEVGQNTPNSSTVIWQLTLQPGDFLEAFVHNDTDTTNLIVTSCKLRVN